MAKNEKVKMTTLLKSINQLAENVNDSAKKNTYINLLLVFENKDKENVGTFLDKFPAIAKLAQFEEEEKIFFLKNQVKGKAHEIIIFDESIANKEMFEELVHRIKKKI